MQLGVADVQRQAVRLQAIRSFNRLIADSDDQMALIEGACETLTDSLQYHTAWIALLGAGEAVTAYAASGFDAASEAILRDKFGSGFFPSCMRQALVRQGSVLLRDPATECGDCPVNRNYLGRAALANALCYEGKCYGVLTVSLENALLDSGMEQQCLEELAEDIAVGLARIERTQALAEHRDMLQRTEAIAHIGSWEWDVDTENVRWSDELYRIFGLDPQGPKVPFAEQWKLFPPEDCARLGAAFEACKRDGTPFEVELAILHASGQPRRCVSRGRAMQDAAGRICRLVGSFQDVTAIWQMQQESAQLLKQLEIRHAAAQSALRTREDFLAAISHELRTPLNSIIAFSDLLRDHVSDAKGSAFLDTMAQSSQRMLRMVDNILRYAQLDKGSLRPQCHSFNLLSFCHQVLAQFEPLAAGFDLQLINGGAAGARVAEASKVCTDHDLLTGLLGNLLTNACNFTDRGWVRLAVGYEDRGMARFYRFIVEDSGCGIPKKDIHRLFEPFQRLTPTQQRMPGVGLGLAICRKTADILNGEIRVESEEGKGARFIVELPLPNQCIHQPHAAR